MLIIPSNTTLIVCGIMLIMACLTPLFSAFFRRPRQGISYHETSNTPLPPLSIVIVANNQAEAIEHHLPLMLSQQYAPGFEIIVVIEASDDDTKDVLKQLQERYPQLYTTYIPPSSKYLSRRKLALTLGVKAAHHEWILLTDADCMPNGQQWLASMGQLANDDHDLVLGYTNYSDQTPRFWRFDRMEMLYRQMYSAINDKAYRYSGRNLCFRRSLFMKQNGFLHNLKYLRGEYDFLVNEMSEPMRVAIADIADATITQERPAYKTWQYDYLYYLETRRHLHHGFKWKLLVCIDQCALHLNYIAQLAVFAYAFTTSNWWLCMACVIALIIAVTFRTTVIRRAAKSYGEKLGLVSIPFMEARSFWQHMFFYLRFRTTDRYEFLRR